MFLTVRHIHPSLIFALKARTLALDCSLGNLGRFQPCLKRVEVTDNDKHYTLLRYVINYGRNFFIDEACGLMNGGE